MTLASPRIVILDTSTLAKASADYWSREEHLRDKSRAFLSRLVDQGVYIAVTLTHVCELLRHDNDQTRRDRLRFLRALRLVAWLRPYDRHWFPGGIPDLLTRELHAVVHSSSKSWREIVNEVRPDLWETGVGADMFVDNDELWSAIHAESRRQLDHEKMVASVARTDAGQMDNLKLSQALQLPRRPKEERAGYMRRFAVEMKRQLESCGDKRLTGAQGIAASFAIGALREMEGVEALGGDPVQRLFECRGVPPDLVKPEMTIGEIGEIAVYAERMKSIARKLRPAAAVRISDFPPSALPSYAIERKLARLQAGADRVSGSDLGDGHIAPLALYSDGVEVDKRTLHHLKRIQRKPEFAALMAPVFRSSDYKEINASVLSG